VAFVVRFELLVVDVRDSEIRFVISRARGNLAIMPERSGSHFCGL
jgi:hypothetical protein